MFKKVEGFSRYTVDEYGNLYSVDYKRSGKTVKLKPAPNKSGYLATMLLNDDGKYKSILVHKIVAMAFLGEQPKDTEIDHIDGCKTNNKPSNLEYVSHSENLRRAFKVGLEKPQRGEENPTSKLTAAQVKKIRGYVASSNKRYYGRKELAKRYGVSECCIKEIVNRRRNTWQDV